MPSVLPEVHKSWQQGLVTVPQPAVGLVRLGRTTWSCRGTDASAAAGRGSFGTCSQAGREAEAKSTFIQANGGDAAHRRQHAENGPYSGRGRGVREWREKPLQEGCVLHCLEGLENWTSKKLVTKGIARNGARTLRT